MRWTTTTVMLGAPFVCLVLTGCIPEHTSMLAPDMDKPTVAYNSSCLEAATPTPDPPCLSPLDSGDNPTPAVATAAADGGSITAASGLFEEEPTAGTPALADPPSESKRTGGPYIWAITGIRIFPCGEQMAPNGLEYNQLFSLDLDLNFWLWRSQGLYLFTDIRFWGQKPGAGITNANQGIFDFSKREFDLNLGAAWNYHGNWEARVFAYSYNNLNRGASEVSPSGYADGIGLENRYYLGGTYADLGTEDFDLARATFISIGYYPTKDMVDGAGVHFKPGPFAHAYLTWPVWNEKCYLYLDTEFIATRSLMAKLLCLDGRVAVRPMSRIPRMEFRVGTEDTYDLQVYDWSASVYGAVRFIF